MKGELLYKRQHWDVQRESPRRVGYSCSSSLSLERKAKDDNKFECVWDKIRSLKARINILKRTTQARKEKDTMKPDMNYDAVPS